MRDYAAQPIAGRVTEYCGHIAHLLLCAAICGVILVGLFPPQGPMMAAVPVLLFGVVIICWLMMRQHDRRLCEHCAASIPLNPGAQAARLRTRFVLSHAGSEPRYLLPYLAVLLGSNLLVSSSSGRFVWAAVQASMIYLIVSYTTHRKLQPWCPMCSDGGGGLEHRDDAPPPPPPDRHQLPV